MKRSSHTKAASGEVDKPKEVYSFLLRLANKIVHDVISTDNRARVEIKEI